MTTIQQIFLKCPHCGLVLNDFALMSYTVFRSTVFSDGKSDSQPFVDQDRAIAVCQSCEKLFWRQDARELPFDYEPAGETGKAGDIYDLPFTMQENFQEGLIRFYDELIRNGFASTQERRIYLRIRLWWAVNDLIRTYRPFWKRLLDIRGLNQFYLFVGDRVQLRRSFRKYRSIFRNNLQKLSTLLDPVTDEDKLMLAEIHREMGKRSKALSVLNELKHLNWDAYRKIRSATLFYKRKVFLIHN
jgi:hypothetical protein